MGKIIYGKIKSEKIKGRLNNVEIQGVLPQNANAEESDVFLNKTFFAGNSTKKTGTMDLPGSTATEEDVRVGKTFFAGNNQQKTGVGQFVNPVLATATEEDVFANATFYAGEQYTSRNGGIDPYIVYLEYDDQLQLIENGKGINLSSEDYEQIKQLYLRLANRVFDGGLLYGSTQINI